LTACSASSDADTLTSLFATDFGAIIPTFRRRRVRRIH
jgi:hypothetical protein